MTTTTTSPAPAPHTATFTIDDVAYTYRAHAPAGDRFTRADGDPVTADHVASWCTGLLEADPRHVQAAHLVLARHLAWHRDYTDPADLVSDLRHLRTSPRVCHDILNTSDVTADGLRIAAELSTGTTALLRVALSHGLLNVLSAGPLLAGIAASCSAGSTGPRAAADIATLTLLLVDDSSPTQLTDVITTVRAWGEIGVAFHEHTVDDAVILSTGQPPTGRPMLVHGVPLIPAPGGSLPLTLSAMVVALHTGADRQQAAAAAVDAQALEAGTTWFDAALTVTACRRLQLLSVARDVLVATVPHDADRILHLLADHHALPNATTEQFTVRLCAVTDAVTAGASDTQARDLLALLDAVGDSAGADDVAAILDTWL